MHMYVGSFQKERLLKKKKVVYEATPMIPVSEIKSSLVSKFMDFTKHLANKGIVFKFSLSLSMGFNFSMDFSQDKLAPSRMPEKKRAQAPSREIP